MTNLIPILGDQLSLSLPSLLEGDPERDLVLMAEVMEEATYVRHHKKKIAFIFSAMRHFAEELRYHGWTVEYVKLDDPQNRGSLAQQLAFAVEEHAPQRIIVTDAGEWRVAQDMRRWEETLSTPVSILPDTRYIASIPEFSAWATARKSLRMEFFYRDMRRKTGLLMRGDDPEGGKWNYDAENRKAAAASLFMPQPMAFPHDDITADVLDLVADRFSDHFGDLEPFSFAVTRADAEAAFAHFVNVALPQFGDFQDAMLTGEPFLYHSVIAQYLNCGLLDPLTICQKVEAAYSAGQVPLNAAEGYIRQVIGWREYVRGIYWTQMPEYADSNALHATRDLPEFYWSGDTDMACMKNVVTQTRTHAYAHHIQRLMVTGTFALLAGIEPRQVHEWYLAVYADAYEWVELPNTIGMSQFADGGLLASKPYAASGAYINRMSNYCGSCRYDVKARTGEGACPFNALYWDFLARHKDRLGKNPRMGQMYATLARFSAEERAKITASAAATLTKLD